jgi:hypothetical protein
MRAQLTTLIDALKDEDAVDSPVYAMLPGLQRPTRPATTKIGVAAPAAAQLQSSEDSYATMLQTAREALDAGAFDFAKKKLQDIYNHQTTLGADGKAKTARPRVIQQLALATYKAGEARAKTEGPDHALVAYAEAEALLRQIDAETTTDPETIGVWSGIHKRRAEMATRSPDERKQDLTEAIRAAERGFIIKRDYYNGTNLAYLLNLRASFSFDEDKIADNVLANRVRHEVVDIATRGLERLAANTSTGVDTTTLRNEKYWLAATRAESLIALGDESAEEVLKAALASAPAAWMAETTKSQLDRLRKMLTAAGS